VGTTYKIGTVELLRVKRSGRRLYVNLDRVMAEAFGIEPGHVLKIRILEGIKPEEAEAA